MKIYSLVFDIMN